MLKKVVIANRGEIALRILRACRELDIKTVAVYSTADKDLMHVRLADEAVCIGPANSAESYLNIPAVISAAEITEADAIHPGYGFLAENADFAEKAEISEFTFIGPTAETIEMMGDKVSAIAAMRAAGIPCVPGSNGALHKNDEKNLKLAEQIGYPVIIKAAGGGGGRGMRVVRDAESLIKSIAMTRTEAEAAFGNGTVYMEKFLENPRHIEVQVIGDGKGNAQCIKDFKKYIKKNFQEIVKSDANAKNLIERVMSSTTLAEIAYHLSFFEPCKDIEKLTEGYFKAIYRSIKNVHTAIFLPQECASKTRKFQDLDLDGLPEERGVSPQKLSSTASSLFGSPAYFGVQAPLREETPTGSSSAVLAAIQEVKKKEEAPEFVTIDDPREIPKKLLPQHQDDEENFVFGLPATDESKRKKFLLDVNRKLVRFSGKSYQDHLSDGTFNQLKLAADLSADDKIIHSLAWLLKVTVDDFLYMCQFLYQEQIHEVLYRFNTLEMETEILYLNPEVFFIDVFRDADSQKLLINYKIQSFKLLTTIVVDAYLGVLDETFSTKVSLQWQIEVNPTKKQVFFNQLIHTTNLNPVFNAADELSVYNALQGFPKKPWEPARDDCYSTARIVELFKNYIIYLFDFRYQLKHPLAAAGPTLDKEKFSALVNIDDVSKMLASIEGLPAKMVQEINSATTRIKEILSSSTQLTPEAKLSLVEASSLPFTPSTPTTIPLPNRWHTMGVEQRRKIIASALSQSPAPYSEGLYGRSARRADAAQTGSPDPARHLASQFSEVRGLPH
jgi:hypothetical protein